MELCLSFLPYYSFSLQTQISTLIQHYKSQDSILSSSSFSQRVSFSFSILGFVSKIMPYRFSSTIGTVSSGIIWNSIFIFVYPTRYFFFKASSIMRPFTLTLLEFRLGICSGLFAFEFNWVFAWLRIPS